MEMFFKMSDVKLNNIQAHYSSEINAKKPTGIVTENLPYLPDRVVFSDTEANKKIKAIDNEVHRSAKKDQKKEAKKFWTVYLGIVAIILSIVGVNKLFDIFKKS